MNLLTKLETVDVRVQGKVWKHYRIEPHILTPAPLKDWLKQMQVTENTLTQVVEVNLNKYLDDWVNESGVNLGIALLNIEGLTAEEANERLGRKNPIKKVKTGGWWCGGVNWKNGQPMGNRFGQFKPETRHIDPTTDEKGLKYLSASGVGTDALFLRMPDQNGEVDKDYWKRVYEDKSQIVVWTEGAKKAGAGLTLGIPTIAVFGVWNFISDGELNPEVKTWVKRKGIQYLAFDSDYAENPKCREAIKRFCEEAKKLGTTLRIVTWDSKYKGMDDFIKGEGKEAFLERINQAQTFEQWEKQFNNGETSKTPSANDIAKEIAEEYANKLAFNNETGAWMRYEAKDKGVWTPETDTYIESIVSQILDGKGINFKTHSYLINVIKALRIHPQIIKREWQERSPSEILPHVNGVLEIGTSKLLEHSPQNYLTWTLPRKHDPEAKEWSKINAYLDSASGGNQNIKNVLLCFLNAVLKGRSDIQKFMHLMGLGGSGKGTIARLAIDLIGIENTCNSSVELFCSNRFETVNAYRKRLLIFADEMALPKDISNLMKTVGGDYLRAEQKNKPAFQYRFDGMVLMISEHPIAQGVRGNGWKRRVISVPMNVKVADKNRRDLNKEFQPELAAFTNYLLSFSDEFVTQTLRGVSDIPELKAQFWESRLSEDAMAAWVNDCLIYDTTAFTPTGSDKDEAVKNNGIVETLYGSYCDYCKRSGNNSLSYKKFSSALEELCQSTLGWKVEKTKTEQARGFLGLRLRGTGDDIIPTYEESLKNILTDSTRQADGLADGLDNSETLTQSDSQKILTGLTGFSNSSEKNKQRHKGSQNDKPHDSTELEKTVQAENPFKVGDRIILLDCDKTGEVVEIDNSRHKKTLNIRLENGVETWQDPYFIELAPVKQPEPKPEAKPALAKYTPDQKKKWLKRNQDIKATVWVKHPSYTGEATYERFHFNEPCWKVKHPNGELNVKTENIEVLKALCGDIHPIPDKPEHTQPELPLESQAETPVQRVKRLVKQISELGEKKQTQTEVLAPYLEKFGKSRVSELTDDQVTELADKLQEQVGDAEKFLRGQKFYRD
jgi:putative DNA primase/helicase